MWALTGFLDINQYNVSIFNLDTKTNTDTKSLVSLSANLKPNQVADFLEINESCPNVGTKHADGDQDLKVTQLTSSSTTHNPYPQTPNTETICR